MLPLTSDNLAGLLSTAPLQIFIAFSIFCRIAAAAALLPGIGEQAVPSRVKLGAALALSIALWPLTRPAIGALPVDFAGFVLIVLAEIIAGLLIGLWVRMFVFVLQIAGAIIGQQMSFSHLFAGPNAPAPQPGVANIFTLSAIAIIFATGFHLEIYMALASSYSLLPWGAFPLAEDTGFSVVEAGQQALSLGLKLSLPFLIGAFIYNLGLGALSRAMPQLLVTFIGAPALMAGGIALLAITLPLLLGVWFTQYRTMIEGLF